MEAARSLREKLDTLVEVADFAGCGIMARGGYAPSCHTGRPNPGSRPREGASGPF